MSKTTLLSPELRKKVEDAVMASFETCEKHYKQTFTLPEIRFDIRNTNGGEAWIKRNLIRLNLTFLVENEAEFLGTTVPHEVAHLVAHHVYDSKPINGKKVRPHGKEWKEVMGVLKLEPKRTHSYDITSLDLHKKPRKTGMLTTAVKISRLLKQIEKLEAIDREYVVEAIREMGDE